jgi:hypothetical protein
LARRAIRKAPREIPPLTARGWQLPLRWFVIARRGLGGSYQKLVRSAASYEDAKAMRAAIIGQWDSVELRSEEKLTKPKK